MKFIKLTISNYTLKLQKKIRSQSHRIRIEKKDAVFRLAKRRDKYRRKLVMGVLINNYAT